MTDKTSIKKLAALALTALLALSAAGCAGGGDVSEDSVSASSSKEASEVSGISEISEISEVSEPDTEKPVITSNAAEVTIRRGANYDIFSGITGHDNADGDITASVTAEKGGFDPAVPGEYMITYTLKDSAGNEALPVSRKITVERVVLAEPPVYSGTAPGEVTNPADPEVYGGAWYRKVVSSSDKWVGIEGTVTLPEVTIRRYSGSYDSSVNADPAVKNLDNPSIYMGGHAASESDVGLSFSKALINKRSNTISTGSIVFRPFWRYITSENQDLGGYDVHDGKYAVSANGRNCFANYHWSYTEYYYLPGDTLRIVVYSPEPDMLQLQIEVISKSTLPESVAMREKYGWKDPADFVSPVFCAPGNGTGLDCEFKRVNAIDQSANEGKTAIATETAVTGAVWQNTYLYRVIDGVLYRLPMTDERRGAICAPYDSAFTVAAGENGGETVSIHPGQN